MPVAAVPVGIYYLGAATIAAIAWYMPGGGRDMTLKAVSGHRSAVMQSENAQDQASQQQGSATGTCPTCGSSEVPKTPEQVADEGSPHPTKPTTGTGIRQVVKPGGMAAADKDFDSMNPTNQKIYPKGTRSVLCPTAEPPMSVRPATPATQRSRLRAAMASSRSRSATPVRND